MSNTLIALIMNFGLAILLIATIAYCSKLSKKIKMLQDGRSELAEMVIKFDNATNKAVSSVNDMQIISKKITESLQL
ncbi:MAG: hypothetical protein WCJ33_04630, partial [Pseudomonadota bacterium]